MNFKNFYPDRVKDKDQFDYIEGSYTDSIAFARFYYLRDLARIYNGNIKISLRDPRTNYWTKWLNFFNATNKMPEEAITHAYDLHRSLLSNEIVVESDYKDYKDNVEASRIVGRIMEEKGFIPHYYYSGSKSIHVHIFLDFSKFDIVLDELRENVSKYFESNKQFYDSFIIWIREQMITCWGLNLREFDKDLIRSTHLIRAELSQNKKGHKTFLGYSYKDLPDEPTICNYKTKIYPSIATTCPDGSRFMFKRKDSTPNDLESIVREFLAHHHKIYTINKMIRKSSSFAFANSNYKNKTLRKGVKTILNDDFSTTKDGMKRALFIICNELKQIYPKNEALELVKNWNIRMGTPFKYGDISFRINSENKYFLKTSYINEFLEEIGILKSE